MADITPVRQVIYLSGLTAAQNARLLGVTPRRLHEWCSAGSLSERHAERAARVRDVLIGLPVDSTENRRLLLLSSVNGRSLFHRLVDENPEPQRIQYDALTVRERIGAA